METFTRNSFISEVANTKCLLEENFSCKDNNDIDKLQIGGREGGVYLVTQTRDLFMISGGHY